MTIFLKPVIDIDEITVLDGIVKIFLNLQLTCGPPKI